VRGSPTWVLNEGRQVIYGNVGYRVLNANVEELINRPIEEASWC
jgi:CubicO group peptidase (beta-lactamase class C family)